jgi:hypothetical protein
MTVVKHPAKYPEAVLQAAARYIDIVDGTALQDGVLRIIDPFAGTGRVGWLKRYISHPTRIIANEIEREWAAEGILNGCDQVIVGDARAIPFDVLNGADVAFFSVAYGNRLADAANWAPGRKHRTYTSALRETVGDPERWLQDGNAGAMQWGDERYCDLHRVVYGRLGHTNGLQGRHIIRPNGRLVLSIADHYRDGVLQGVPEWHVAALLAAGFRLLDWVEVETPRYGFGANADKRAPEMVILFDRPAPSCPSPAWSFTPTDRRPGHLWDVMPEAPQPVQLSLLAGGAP